MGDTDWQKSSSSTQLFKLGVSQTNARVIRPLLVAPTCPEGFQVVVALNTRKAL
jgi:hypothetical protein